MAAVVDAKWDCRELQELAKLFETKEIGTSDTENALRKLQDDASRKRKKRNRDTFCTNRLKKVRSSGIDQDWG